MGAAKTRRIEAREHRQESLHNRGTTVETTIQLPQPKNLVKNEVIKVSENVSNKLPKVTEIAKRGRGRPPKAVSDKNITAKKVAKKIGTKKPVVAKGKK
jgi:hypothetical protein